MAPAMPAVRPGGADPRPAPAAARSGVIQAVIATIALAVVVTACGAGGGDGAAIEPSEPTQTTRTTLTARTGDVGSSADLIEYRVEVVATHPHDERAYTQGLEFVNGALLESTGRVGQSSLRVVEPTTGRVQRSVAIDESLFAEGATVVGDEVWQLTWKDEVLLVHDLDRLVEQRRIPYEGEGWGLCATADRLVMSNGSDRLSLRDRATFDEIGSVDVVAADDRPVGPLNELECVGDEVWANIYQQDRIISIDVASGRITGSVDLSELVPSQFVGDLDNVANGIAYDPATGRFWLTGKRWPVMYEVELVAER